MAKSADTATKKWMAAMAGGQARQNYIDGINNTQVNPMAEAATPQALQKYADACALSVSSGRRANKLNSVSPAVWKANAVNIGATRLAQAAQKGGPKYTAWAQGAAATWQAMSDAAKRAQGPLEKVRAALNVQLAAAGKPQI
jgi:hypothetical protein